MRITKVEVYYVTAILSAEDCLLLAEVCARWEEISRERAKDVAHVETMGAAFEAAAIASIARWSMCKKCNVELDEALGEVRETAP